MFHLSALGQGHSGTLQSVSGLTQTYLLPPSLKYEACWWNRVFKFDYESRNLTFDDSGRLVPIHGPSEAARQLLAFQNAKEYANLVSIGNLHALRQFLDATLSKTEWLGGYANAFRQILNPRGQVQYDRRLKLINGLSQNMDKRLNTGLDRYREAFKKVCLGLTRERKLLVPEWADDGSLWVPPPVSSRIIVPC